MVTVAYFYLKVDDHLTTSNYSVHILSHIEKRVYFTEEADEVTVVNKIEVNLSQEKINFINDVYRKELHYWKKVALEIVSAENE